MKKSIPFLITVLSILIVSCSNNEESLINIENSNETSIESFNKSFSNLSNAIVSQEENLHKLLIGENLRSGSNQEYTENQISIMSSLSDNIYEESITFLKELSISKEDIELIYGKSVSINELSKEDIAGLALFYHSFCVANGISLDGMNLRSSSVADCFLEATGIAAGVAIIGALSGKAIGRAGTKAIIKAAARIGGRTLGGIGLALMAAEFTYCMLTN